MIGSVERYSSNAGRKRAGVLGGRILRGIIIALFLYLLASRFFVSTYRIESVSMEPALSPADRIIASLITYGPRAPLSAKRFPGIDEPQRGDLVVVRPPFFEEPGLFNSVLEPLVSFFTAQRVTLRRDLSGARVNGYMVKRLVGLPGDTVRLASYLLMVKPRGGSQFIPEQQLAPTGYEVLAESRAKGWDASLPLSGNSADLVLGDGQYYVLGDNRPESSDSRSWGPLSRDRIIAKVVYRYWPPRSIGPL